MRRFGLAVTGVAIGALLVVSVLAPPAEARCRVWEATHNGSGLFYPRDGGGAGTAANKLVWQVEQWQKRTGIKKVRISKIATHCGDSFMKYLLPHRHCIARARVCY